jgi:DNA mismatch repair protein MutH
VGFDYRDATEMEILDRARPLVGLTLGEIGAASGHSHVSAGKGGVGLAIEAFFGIPPNSRSEADFPAAGIELKVLPMKRQGRDLAVKERTVVSMIDYEAIVEETWASAKVRHKLHILFVYYEHLDDRAKREFPILEVTLWGPDDRTDSLLQADWERVQAKVRHGFAHQLSESDGRILGPCTKGPNAGYLRRQPFSQVRAKSRAFALKPAFTLELFRAVRASGLDRSTVQVDDARTFEEVLVARFEPFVGKTVQEAADVLGIKGTGSKSYAAGVARRIFGARSFKTEIKQFAEMGLTPRVTRVRKDLTPYEATSFPTFRYKELINETWEDSDLLARVEYMLFLPLIGQTKQTPQGACRFGEPRFWRPSAAMLELMRSEWELYRLEIERGSADRLTPASETVALHVRPHGRNSTDTDDAPIIGPVVKKSFWLNRSFVGQILRGER